MTEDEKRRRRDRIERVSRKQQPKQMVGTMTYWMTRDADAQGRLDGSVRIWLIRPDFKRRPDGSTYWECPDVEVESANGPVRARYGSWELAVCIRSGKAYPETSHECLRVG